MGQAFSPAVFGAVAAPLGGSIEVKFIAGIVLCAALAVFGFRYFRKLTPMQQAEQDRMAALARGEAVEAPADTEPALA